MALLRQLAVVVALLLQSLALLADDVITEVMSPVASFQYSENFENDVLTSGGVVSPFVSYQYSEDFRVTALSSGGILSPIASYHYLEWPGDDILHLNSSRPVSYYYPPLDAPVLPIVLTSRVPNEAEIKPSPSPVPTESRLLVFHNGAFVPDLQHINPERPTVVVTHGWIPLIANFPLMPNGGVEGWPTHYASVLRLRPFNENILAWDWNDAARSGLGKPNAVAQNTPDEGLQLGRKLLNALGPNYAERIQFIGHSFGTLVNGWAANYLHGDQWGTEEKSPNSWSANNTLMTLFDEAEVGREFSSFLDYIDALSEKNENPFARPKPYDHPLPKYFAWAENYVSAVGLMKPNAVNVLLNFGFPEKASGPIDWTYKFADFHAYPVQWYENTLLNDTHLMGFLWPATFLFQNDFSFGYAPRAGRVFVQGSSEWDLTGVPYEEGVSLVEKRFERYRREVAYAVTGETPESLQLSGTGSGQYLVGAMPAFDSFYYSLTTKPPQSQLRRSQVLDGGNAPTNTPAYSWFSIPVPTNAVSFSFDYRIDGDWVKDSLSVAFNGTNVFLFPGGMMETNIFYTSGPIDISSFAGSTNEIFVGIVGGTSTNAQVMIANVRFTVPFAPVLKSHMVSSNIVLAWPLSFSNYALETSTNLHANEPWIPLTNQVSVENVLNTVSNAASGAARYYRLKKGNSVSTEF
jgi:hypothetical protein